MRVAPAIDLSDEELTTLTKWSRGRSTQARRVQRAQIVLLAAKGKQNKEIATELRTTPRTAGIWRRRFAELRIAGIEKDLPRAGRTPTRRRRIESRILAKTTQALPANATHWTSNRSGRCRGLAGSVSLTGSRRLSPRSMKRVWTCLPTTRAERTCASW